MNGMAKVMAIFSVACITLILLIVGFGCLASIFMGGYTWYMILAALFMSALFLLFAFASITSMIDVFKK